MADWLAHSSDIAEECADDLAAVMGETFFVGRLRKLSQRLKTAAFELDKACTAKVRDDVRDAEQSYQNTVKGAFELPLHPMHKL